MHGQRLKCSISCIQPVHWHSCRVFDEFWPSRARKESPGLLNIGVRGVELTVPSKALVSSGHNYQPSECIRSTWFFFHVSWSTPRQFARGIMSLCCSWIGFAPCFSIGIPPVDESTIPRILLFLAHVVGNFQGKKVINLSAPQYPVRVSLENIILL